MNWHFFVWSCFMKWSKFFRNIKILFATNSMCPQLGLQFSIDSVWDEWTIFGIRYILKRNSIIKIFTVANKIMQYLYNILLLLFRWIFLHIKFCLQCSSSISWDFLFSLYFILFLFESLMLLLVSWLVRSLSDGKVWFLHGSLSKSEWLVYKDDRRKEVTRQQVKTHEIDCVSFKPALNFYALWTVHVHYTNML